MTLFLYLRSDQVASPLRLVSGRRKQKGPEHHVSRPSDVSANRPELGGAFMSMWSSLTDLCVMKKQQHGQQQRETYWHESCRTPPLWRLWPVWLCLVCSSLTGSGNWLGAPGPRAATVVLSETLPTCTLFGLVIFLPLTHTADFTATCCRSALFAIQVMSLLINLLIEVHSWCLSLRLPVELFMTLYKELNKHWILSGCWGPAHIIASYCLNNAPLNSRKILDHWL